METDEPRNGTKTEGSQARAGIMLAIFFSIVLIPLITYDVFFRPTNVYYETGMTAFRNNQYETAAAEFQLDVKQDSKHSLGYYYLGRSLQATGRIQDAATAYQNAYDVETASDHPDSAFAGKCLAYERSCAAQVKPH